MMKRQLHQALKEKEAEDQELVVPEEADRE